jgi:hypothetical protein
MLPAGASLEARAAGSGGGYDAGMEEGLELNRASWDERAPAHAASPDYGFDRFASDAS